MSKPCPQEHIKEMRRLNFDDGTIWHMMRDRWSGPEIATAFEALEKDAIAASWIEGLAQ